MGLEFLSEIILIGVVLYFNREIAKLKNDIFLVSKNPPLAKRTLKKDPRYKKSQ